MAKGKEHAPYIPLHVHSNYSLIEVGKRRIAATSHPEHLVKTAHKKGIEALALTDTNFLSLVRFMEAAEAAGMKAIPGIELPVEFSPIDPTAQTTFLAKNTTGLFNLFELATKVQRDRELLTPNDIECISENAIVLLRGKLSQFRDLLGQDGIFISVDSFDHKNLTVALEHEGKTKKTVVAHEVRMAEPSQVRIFNLILKLFANSGRGIDPSHPLNYTLKAPVEIAAYYRNIPAALARTQEIAQESEVLLPERPRLKAEIAKGKDSYRVLESLVWEGAKKFSDHGILKEKIIRELDLVKLLGLADYYLIIYEINQYLENRGIPSLSEGSINNSSIAMVLGFTQVDATDLMLERFINPDRVDYPDADTGLPYDRRQEVLDFVFNKYGSATQLAVVRRIRSQGVVQLAERARVKLSENQKKELVKVELPKEAAVHPSGIIFFENAPQMRVGENAFAQFDKEDADILGLPKIDLLSRNRMARIDRTLRLLKDDGITPEISENDEATFNRLFGEAKTIGISDVESPHLRRILKTFGLFSTDKPKIDNLAQLLALARFAGSARGRYFRYLRYGVSLHAEYLSRFKDIASILEKTSFVVIYQEQVMRIATEVAGLPLPFANKLRKMMSEDFPMEEREELIQTLSEKLAQKYPSKVTEELVLQLKNFMSYGFVDGHAKALAHTAYELSFLAEHYPAHFWASVVSIAADRQDSHLYPLQAYINEALREKIKFEFPAFDDMQTRSSVENGKVVLGRDILEPKKIKERKVFPRVYEEYWQDINQQDLSAKETAMYQLKHFGVSLTQNPIILYDQALHFNPKKAKQEIAGQLLLSREFGDIVFVTLDSGELLDTVISTDMVKKHKKNLKKPFWRVQIKRQRISPDGWQIIEVFPPPDIDTNPKFISTPQQYSLPNF